MSTRGDLVRRKLAERAANPHHARREDESDAEYAARVRHALSKPRGDAMAPCGHEGETVIGSYVRCLQGCDATGKAVDPLDVIAEQKPMRYMSVGYSASVGSNGRITISGPVTVACAHVSTRHHNYDPSTNRTWQECQHCDWERDAPPGGSWGPWHAPSVAGLTLRLIGQPAHVHAPDPNQSTRFDQYCACGAKRTLAVRGPFTGQWDNWS